MRHEGLEVNWKPKELDYFLQRNYSYSLWHFSLSLAEFLLFYKDYRSIKKKESGKWELHWTMFWKKRIFELNQLKKTTKETLTEFLEKAKYPNLEVWKIEMLMKRKTRVGDSDYIEKMFGLSSFFETLNRLIKEMNKILISSKTKGRPLKKTTIIALTWSHFIKDDDETHLVNIVNLLDWFKKRLPNSAIYKSFGEEINKIQNYKLKQIIYRHKTKSTHKNLINCYKNTFEKTVGSRTISFEGMRPKITAHLESNWNEYDIKPPLVSFSEEEKFTAENFKENSIKANVSYKNLAYMVLFK